ncbi:TetR/AcrR family transcriptional regulator C-terminal domain-containing protein [Streptomyces sp. NPDC003077]|uniref:TetR/AcrR family transcriptional regulator C-terminal domain-containing protein n=1 Tax=Streptomyces sp. NPDC003077 TaxID=3154443 RepID=UPI0033B49FC7
MAGKRNRGERAGLSREMILDAAGRLVNRDGLKSLSMRRLAGELGVEAMTLYHYLPSKEALLDGLVERVLTQALPLPDPHTGWRPLLRSYADALRTALLRSPALLPLLQTRPAVTPATLAAAERGIAALVAAGFPLGKAVHAVNALTVLVLGHTATEAGTGGGVGGGSGTGTGDGIVSGSRTGTGDGDDSGSGTGTSDGTGTDDGTGTGAGADAEGAEGARGGAAEAGAGTAAWLAGRDEEEYPLLVRAARTDQGTDDAERFTFAVDALLTGFAACLDEAGDGDEARRGAE